MGKFLESEKTSQSQFKRDSPSFSSGGRQKGEWDGAPQLFCLPARRADENLFPGFRTEAVEWFRSHQIIWHDNQNGRPSNHLCDGQVCCVNFLFAFADSPEPLAALLRPVFPGLKRMLPVEDGKFVTFEWIGAKNYMNERMRPDRPRTRGATFTRTAAVVAFEQADGRNQIALIEWNYTESYHSIRIKPSSRGTDRTAIYQDLFDQPECPLDQEQIPVFDALLFEPFYQLMRQQFLAQKMERGRELNAEIVSLLHIAPAHNTDFRKVTSPSLKALGNTAMNVWDRLVRVQEPRRFRSVSTEALFAPLLKMPPAGLEAWAGYINQRYPWAADTAAV